MMDRFMQERDKGRKGKLIMNSMFERVLVTDAIIRKGEKTDSPLRAAQT